MKIDFKKQEMYELGLQTAANRIRFRVTHADCEAENMSEKAKRFIESIARDIEILRDYYYDMKVIALQPKRRAKRTFARRSQQENSKK